MKRVLPAIVLFFLAPLVAEFLLGDFPLSWLAILLFMAPMYGGGALLIREFVRRTGRGWTAIFVLAFAYGIFEEAFTTQSLFNPNYTGKNLHLLQPAYISALGIGAWWTVFVITLHTVWSISTSIALAEAFFPERASEPWLKNVGLSIVGILFVLSSVLMSFGSVKQDKLHFIASTPQFVSSAVICMLAIVAAVLIPKPKENQDSSQLAPGPWIVGVIALAEGSIFLTVPKNWAWRAIGIYFLLYIIAIVLFSVWSKRKGWGALHRFALAGGAALAYGWHAFMLDPVVSVSYLWARISNAVFALALIVFLVATARRNAAFEKTRQVAGV